MALCGWRQTDALPGTERGQLSVPAVDRRLSEPGGATLRPPVDESLASEASPRSGETVRRKSFVVREYNFM